LQVYYGMPVGDGYVVEVRPEMPTQERMLERTGD
jgi:hypothetical protein